MKFKRKISEKRKFDEQAGAELCQAQEDASFTFNCGRLPSKTSTNYGRLPFAKNEDRLSVANKLRSSSIYQQIEVFFQLP